MVVFSGTSVVNIRRRRFCSGFLLLRQPRQRWCQLPPGVLALLLVAALDLLVSEGFAVERAVDSDHGPCGGPIVGVGS